MNVILALKCYWLRISSKVILAYYIAQIHISYVQYTNNDYSQFNMEKVF